MTAAQEQAWLTLFQLTAGLGRSWCLVGGQMVHLYCAERGMEANRLTEDADTMLDIRAHPDILERFTQALVDLGWTSAGESPEGHQHRWVRESAQIDVLIPTNVGKRAAERRGTTAGTTVQAPGGQQALDRAELISVNVAGTVGEVPRPNLAGALVIKAAAYGNRNDRHRDRHLIDFAALAAMIQLSDRLATTLGRRDLEHLRPTLTDLQARRELITTISGADRGVDVLAGIIRDLAP